MYICSFVNSVRINSRVSHCCVLALPSTASSKKISWVLMLDEIGTNTYAKPAESAVIYMVPSLSSSSIAYSYSP